MEKLVDIIAKFSSVIGQMEESSKEQFNFNDLTLTQMSYLETIYQLRNPNLTELSSEMNLTKPTVKVAIDKLIEKDYIYRVQSDEDRRSAHLHLTEKGKHLNQMHDEAHKRMAEMIGYNLEPTEIKQLEVLLGKVFRRH
jgi:DNA-binding MarR family transcriptional regulator